jgi:transcriptional regulator of acetoin/glycerol metabolism
MTSLSDISSGVERVRERFLSTGPLDDDAVRPDLLDSWRRSHELGINPDGAEPRFVREPNTESRLSYAASLVLQRITEDLAAQEVSVVLTSADAVVLERAAGDVAILRALDKVLLVPGYSLAEDIAGTNGIGTALETGRPALIRGGEHYVGTFASFACAGAPIRDPVTRKVIGVVDLSCVANHSDPLLLALAKSASRQIEDRMKAVVYQSETELLDAYLQQVRRFPRGVLAVGGDVVLMNRALRQSLEANDQVALLEQASGLLSSRVAGTILAVLPSGSTAKITALDRTVIRGGRTSGVFRIDLSVKANVPTLGIRRPARTPIHGLAGRSSSWLRSCQEVERYCREREWLVLEGEKGVGRAKLAQAVGRHVNLGRTVRVLRSETIATAAHFLAELVLATDGDDFAVVIADVDGIPDEAIGPIASVLQSRSGRGWIAVTVSSAAHSPMIETLLLPLFAHTVTVPALRHRIEDIEELAPFLLREIIPGADVRLAPDAMSQLRKLPWPGNVAQLRRALAETVARQRSGVIGADKLPPECRAVTRRKLTQIEALERDAIVRSLEENGGNKSDAAQALGMSRATIYRKVNDYGIA